MARVTVEDCVQRVPNRFELVMLAAQRARDIAGGSQIELERDNDKDPVVALREIAEDKVNDEQLRDELIRGLQKYIDTDEPEEEDELEAFAQSLLHGKPEAEAAPSADEDKAEDEDAAAPEDEGGMPSFDDVSVGRDD